MYRVFYFLVFLPTGIAKSHFYVLTPIKMIVRVSNSLDPDAEISVRVSNSLDPDAEIIVRVSNSLDSDETSSYSASHPDPLCLHPPFPSKKALFVYETCCRLIIRSTSLSVEFVFIIKHRLAVLKAYLLNNIGCII